MSSGTCIFGEIKRLGIALMLTFFLVGFTRAAENCTVTVIRKDNNRPLMDAIVKVLPLNNPTKGKVNAGLTNTSGQFFFSITEPSVVLISYLGFVTITDTFQVAQDKVYYTGPVSQEINDVVVTGQYSPNSSQKSVYEVKVISAEMIKSKGANNLREALQNELSIDLGQDQVFGSSLGINGISGEGIKIMVDGVPIVGRLDGKLDLSQININNIERIEIVEGPLSVMYGTDAMGGVINIITKSFQPEKVNVQLRTYYETVGQYNIDLSAGFSFRKSQVFLSGGRYFFDGFTTADSIPRFMEWKPKEQYFADAKYMYSGNKFRFSFTGAFFSELMVNRSAPKQTLSYDNNDTSWTYTGADLKYLTYRPRASASMMYRFNENSQLDVLLAYSGFFRFTNKYDKNLVTLKETLVDDPEDQDTARYHQILMRSTYSLPAWKNKLNFQFGIEINQEFTSQTRIKEGRQSSGDYAAYGSIRYNIVKGLDIQPAIRLIYNTRFRAPLVPSFNIKYNWDEKLVLRASYGKGYRAPSLKELYLVFFDSNHSLQGNPNLRAENGHIVNGSFNYTQTVKAHAITYGVSGFYNNINDKIDWQIIPSIGPELDTFEYINIKKYITYGGDVSIGYKWKRLQLNASAMLTNYRLSNTQSGSDRITTWSPDFTASASYKIPVAEIGITVFYKFNGRKPLFSVNNSLQTGFRDAYHMLDVSFNRNFWKDRIQLIIGGKNLVGVSNVGAQNISSIGHNFGGNAVNIGWGRTFFTSLVFRFAK